MMLVVMVVMVVGQRSQGRTFTGGPFTSSHRRQAGSGFLRFDDDFDDFDDFFDNDRDDSIEDLYMTYMMTTQVTGRRPGLPSPGSGPPVPSTVTPSGTTGS
nr:uncharacterized protein LOC128697028 [Cherax quadricarinatus]